MWTELRRNIESIRKEHKILETDFKPVDIHSWEGIEEKIYSTFYNSNNYVGRLVWLWSDFKQEKYAVQFFHNWPFEQLLKLAAPSEHVWLFVNETINERTKFWFYEGRINTIVFVLGESFVDEVYIASKKYEWLLCINHHDILIATGKHMPAKLRDIEKTLER